MASKRAYGARDSLECLISSATCIRVCVKPNGCVAAAVCHVRCGHLASARVPGCLLRMPGGERLAAETPL